MKSLAEQIAGRCVHFTGTQNERCEAGLVYTTVCGGDAPGWGRRLPCLRDSFPETPKAECASARFPTTEEAQAEANASLARMRSRFETIARGECPQCGAKIELRQVGHCVYGSCGHRLYQGKIPARKGTPA